VCVREREREREQERERDRERERVDCLKVAVKSRVVQRGTPVVVRHVHCMYTGVYVCDICIFMYVYTRTQTHTHTHMNTHTHSHTHTYTHTHTHHASQGQVRLLHRQHFQRQQPGGLQATSDPRIACLPPAP
jgi:hypothetical protein